MRAIASVRALVDNELRGQCRLAVVDVVESPDRAEEERIVTTPTLVRRKGDSRRLVVGDMTRPDVVLRGLALESLVAPAEDLGAMAEILASFRWGSDAAHRMDAWVDALARVVEPLKGRETLREYVLGLLRPGASKSAKRMAHRGRPESRSARYQAMHHMVARAPWDDRALTALARDRMLRAHFAQDAVAAWVIGERRIPRGGRSAVGLSPAPRAQGGLSAERSTTAPAGPGAMCQRAVTLACVTADGEAAPAGFRLFLPPSWSEHPARRQRSGIPATIAHSELWAIAIDLVDEALEAGVPVGPVCVAGARAAAPSLAMALRRRGLGYAVETPPAALVVPAESAGLGLGPLPAHEVARRAGAPGVIPLEPDTLDSIWDPASPAPSLAILTPEETPTNGHEGTTFWLVGGPGAEDPELLSEMPAHAQAMYDDAAERAGLDSYTGRGWVGFHHHASLCMAAYAFLVSEDLEN